MNKNSLQHVAVVGVSALFPGSQGGQAFWRNILAGTDFMGEVPSNHWLLDDYHDEDQTRVGKTYARRGAFLPKVDFDPMAFGMPPKQLSTTDTAQLLALIVATKVLEDASSVQFDKVDPANISVILGVASATELVGQMAGSIQRPHWVKALREAGIPESKVQEVCDGIEKTYPAWDESTFPGLLGNVVAGRIANRLDLGGTNCVVDAACASSLGGVSIQELQLGHSDLVITGGVDALNDIFMYMCFSKTPALSPTGDCRPFSDAADGTMLGEGIGMVALRRLEDAERDGDKIYAVIRGMGSASDGRAKSIYAPRAQGQELAIRRAYENAGYTVDDVGMIDAHGTATKAGDAAEMEGLKRAFSDTNRTDHQWCALGSVKSQIGHTKSAAGSASLFKAVMALHHKVLPPTIKVDRPNPALEIEASPFYLNTETRPWIMPPGAKRRASVSAFGFGGSNFHVTLEEYTDQVVEHQRYHNSPAELLLFSGDSPDALLGRVSEVSAAVETDLLANVARSVQEAFDSTAGHRLAIIAADSTEFLENAGQARSSIESDPHKAFSMPNRLHYGVGPGDPAVGFLFSGQGSQYTNMGSHLAMEFDSARSIWDQVAGLKMDPEKRLDQVVFPIPVFTDEERKLQQEELTRTHWAQPAIGTVSVSMLEILKRLGVRPKAVAGHSYGELTALYASGAIASPTDLVAISRKRGELMTEAASTPGSMTAVKASAGEVDAMLGDSDAGVSVANINSPTQVVIAGPTSEIDKAEEVLTAAGATFRRLPVATAFHTSLVGGCEDPFYAYLGDFSVAAPGIPVYANTTAELYPHEPDEIKRALARQLANPVQFQQIVEKMHEDGIRLFVEVGPGNVLSAMVRDTLKDKEHTVTSLDNRKADGRAALWNALGVMSVSGVALDYAHLWAEFADDEGLTDTDCSPVTVQIDGANYGKPYPSEAGSRPGPNPEPAIPVAASQPESIQPVPTSGPEQEVEHEDTHMSNPVDTGWASAFSVLQQQTLEAQKAFQQTLSESHAAFLHSSEVAFAQLAHIATGTATGTATGMTLAAPAPRVPAMPLPQSPAQQPPAPTPVPEAPPAVVPQSAAVQAPVTQPAPVVAEAPAVSAASGAGAQDFEALLLEVVSDKTGYPIEMLSMDMELEAGLGIDSIKRVEILSVLQEQIPQLEEVDTAELAELNTLGEILQFALQSAPAAPVVPLAGATPAPAPTADFEALLLDVVADKTGYPVEMLSLDMELESGLGIDSIKRVEILSVLQDQLPHLADVDTAELAELNTLGEILEFASSTAGGPEPVKKPRDGQPTAAAHIDRLAVRCLEQAAPGIAMSGLTTADTVYLVEGNSGVAEPLARKLAAAGISSEVVTEPPSAATALVLLAGLNSEDSPEGYAALNTSSFASLGKCAASMFEAGRLLVTLQDTGGDFGASGSAGMRAWSGGLSALAKTAAIEWPHASVKAIDVEVADRDADAVAEQVFNELVGGGSELEVGLKSSGERLVLRAVPADEQGDPTPLTPDDVLVVSGGARGVTAACIQAAMSRTPARVAILGRTALAQEPADVAALDTDAELKKLLLTKHQASGDAITPLELNAEVSGILASREVRDNLSRLEETGARVMYLPVDISDGPAVVDAMARVATELGPVSVLVHAAGVLADKQIHEKTPEQFQSVFSTKVDGLINLLGALRDAELKHLICFSSVAARSGNAGQVDYAMANEVLNRVCHSERARRGGSCQTRSFGWGPWDGGMVNPGLKKHFEAMGVSLIPLAGGAELFADEVEGRFSPDTEIVVGNGFESALPDSASWGLWVHESQQPLINSHVIRDIPVVPMLLANEWVMGAARQLYPQLQVCGTRDMRVLKGIQAFNFTGTGDWFRLICDDTSSPEALVIRIEDESGKLHYSATVELGERIAPVHASDFPTDPWGWDAATVYEDHLFHGPDFQVIEELQGISEAGCVGMLRSSASPCRGNNESDIVVLDGGLQLALLWERNRSGHQSLPTGFRSLNIYRDTPYAGPVQCVLKCVKASSLGVEWSLVYSDANGAVCADMQGVAMHVLPEPESP